MGSSPRQVVQMVHSAPNWTAFNSEIYMHTVMPNLQRLGLVTERTREKYRKIGVLSDSRMPPRDQPLLS
jgi:hypothetical protein